ncbi:MAG: acyl-CoA thioesterase [Bacteroidales bacterium]|nr:acyl-CoA thioesterase [Bacteroidales bacterium]
MLDLLRKSEIRQFRIVLPESLNAHNTLFGGMALKWMDETAYITAKKYCNKEMITVSIEKVEFLLPVRAGSMIELVGKVVKQIRKVKIQVRVEIWLTEENNSVAVYGDFYLAAIDDAHKPVPLLGE